MKKRTLRRASAVSTACLTSFLLTSCDKAAPGLAKANATTSTSVYADTSGKPAASVAPAPATEKATSTLPPAPAPVMAEVPKSTPAPAVVSTPPPTPVVPQIAPAPAPSPVVITGPAMTIKPEMPQPLFQGTPLPQTNAPPNLDTSKVPVLEIKVPEGVALLSKGKPVSTSDSAPIGEPSLATDGDKQGDDGYFVDLMPGKTWLQVDLGESKEIWLLWVWHFHKQSVIYKDVIAQVSDDAEFKTFTTVFNNDFDNSAGFGVGADKSYIETNNGRPMPVNGTKGRYVRFYSNGRDLDDTNQYIEVEVYGK